MVHAGYRRVAIACCVHSTYSTVTEKKQMEQMPQIYENVLVQNLEMTLNIQMAIQACEPALWFVVNSHTHIKCLSFSCRKKKLAISFV